jgi:hypothetical protein
MRTLSLGFAVVALLIVVGSVRADRAGVEWSLDQMRSAVLAGDADAYLSHVVRDDPIFLKEQENWAKDLKLHVPSAFRLSIHDPEEKAEEGDGDKAEASKADADKSDGGAAAPVFDDEIGQARFEMVMEWTMPGLGREGKDISRTVSYPVVFRRGDDGQWRYGGEDWRVVESGGGKAAAGPEARKDAGEGAAGAGGEGDKAKADAEPELPVSDAPNRARYFPGFEDVARTVVKVLPQVRAHVDDGFANHVTHVQEVKIYPSMRHLQASIYLSYVDGLSGWNEPGEAIKLIASNKSSAGHLRMLLGHEYGHVATFEFGPEATNMPWWVLEGVAELSAEKFAAMNQGKGDDPSEYGRGARTTVERWSKRGKLAEWSELSDFRSVKKELMGHVYQQGHHMVGYVSQRFGREGRNTWLRAMGQGKSIDEASREALGMSFEQLDREWRASLPPKEEEPAEEAEKK